MNRFLLALTLSLASLSTLTAETRGWKIETLAPIGRTNPQIPPYSRTAAMNRNGTIAYMASDGIYTIDRQGNRTKRVEDLFFNLPGTLSVSVGGPELVPSLGITEDDTIYYGATSNIFRSRPGEIPEPMTVPLSGQLNDGVSGNIIVSPGGQVFVARNSLNPNVSFSQILKLNGSTFEPIHSATSAYQVFNLGDANESTLAFQEENFLQISQGGFNIYAAGNYKQLSNGVVTDISSKNILNSFAGLSPIALNDAGDSMAYTQSNGVVAKFELGGVTTEVSPKGGSPLSFFHNVAIGNNGDFAYVGGSFPGFMPYNGIFTGIDPALDHVLLEGQRIEGNPRRIRAMSVAPRISDKAEMLITYGDSSGQFFVALATPLPQLVDLNNPSFADGTAGWNTQGSVRVIPSPASGPVLSALLGDPGSAISQVIDLPSVPFKITYTGGATAAGSGTFNSLNFIPDLYLDDLLLEPVAPAFQVADYIISDPNLLGRRGVTLKLASHDGTSPFIIDGIKITAVPEVSPIYLLASAFIFFAIALRNIRRRAS